MPCAALRLVAAAAVTLLLTGACGAGDDPTVDVPTGSARSGADGEGRNGASPSSTALDGMGDDAGDDASPLEGAATSPVSTPPTEYGYLVDVRAATQADGTERVVFEFRDRVPGHRVSYVERPITEGGSGHEVDVKGEAVLEVHFEAASGFDLQAGEPTYEGERRLQPGTSLVQELVRVTDFEGHLDWVIGLRAEVPFRVMTLDSPPRLVIDLAQPREP